MAEGEVDRNRAAVAAANDHHGGGGQSLEQRRRVVALLGDTCAFVWFRALASRAPAPVIGDHAAESCQLWDRLPPHQGRASGPVDAGDRRSLAVLLVVEPDAVDVRLGHDASLVATYRRRYRRGGGQSGAGSGAVRLQTAVPRCRPYPHSEREAALSWALHAVPTAHVLRMRLEVGPGLKEAIVEVEVQVMRLHVVEQEDAGHGTRDLSEGVQDVLSLERHARLELRAESLGGPSDRLAFVPGAGGLLVMSSAGAELALR